MACVEDSTPKLGLLGSSCEHEFSRLCVCHKSSLCSAASWFSTAQSWLCRYALDGWGSFKACLRRDWILMKRNYFLYTFKTMQVCAGRLALHAVVLFSFAAAQVSDFGPCKELCHGRTWVVVISCGS